MLEWARAVQLIIDDIDTSIRLKETEEISLKKLNAYYQSVLPAGRMELYYCGSAPEKRVAGMFRRAFAALPRSGESDIAPTLRREPPESCRIVEEVMDVTQGKLCIGFRTSSTDAAATMMMSAMFGGTSTSKLFLNVREKLSLCYYIGSSNHWKKGMITISSGIDSENYQQAVDEIFAQLTAIQDGAWEDWEMENARSALRNSLRTMEDSAGAMEDFTMGQLATNGEETIEGLLSAIESVTPQRIRDAASAVKPDTIYFLSDKEA